MTPAQADLLKRLIAADRNYHSRIAAGEAVHPDDRGVEVGWINGVNPRTAQSLTDIGLVEQVDILGNGHAYAFLGRYRAYDQVEPLT